MPSRMRAEEARKHFAELIASAEKGQATIIERHGKARAMVVPVASIPRGPTQVKFTDLAGTGKGLWGKDPTTAIDRLRREWD